MADSPTNADSAELGKFNALASHWWDPEGELKTLHQINPVRTRYIAERTHLAGSECLDVGCGGGLLCESMAALGANVCGIDLAPDSIEVARLHLATSGAGNVEYRLIDAEMLADQEPARFDAVTCLEVLEHVPDPEALIAATSRLAKPGGDVFFSTINRTARAFGLAIVAGEYLTGLIPKGTHTYEKLIRPSELTRSARNCGLVLSDLAGIDYDPISESCSLSDDVSVNYIAHFRKAQT